MRTLIILLFVFGIFFNVTADEKDNKTAIADKHAAVIVSGTVADENTGELLVGVEVKLEGTNKKAYTDFDGYFSFLDVTPGEYNITTSYISYEKKKIEKKTIDIFTNEVNVKLKPVN